MFDVRFVRSFITITFLQFTNLEKKTHFIALAELFLSFLQKIRISERES